MSTTQIDDTKTLNASQSQRSYIICEPPEFTWIGAPKTKKPISNPQNPFISKIGGKPAFPRVQDLPANDPQKIPSQVPSEPKCKVCDEKLRFITQIFAPLDDYERFIYVFACINKSCASKNDNLNSGWKAYRFQYKRPTNIVDESQPIQEEDVPNQSNEEKIEDSKKKFTLQEDEVDLDKQLDQLLNQQSNQSTQSKSSLPSNYPRHRGKKNVKKDPDAYNCFELDIFEEPTEEEWLEDNPNSMLAKIVGSHQNNATSNSMDLQDDLTETLEDGSLRLALDPSNPDAKIDAAFLNFEIRLDREPEQSVRWQWKGKPLWTTDSHYPGDFEKNKSELKGKYTTTEILAMSLPKCPRCEANLVFELQIIPTIIYQLGCKEGELDFGSVYVFTCSSSCMESNNLQYDECFVHVQPPL